jgi:multidrug efflux system membrane fusion protein
MTAVEGIKPGDILATSSFEKLHNDSKVVISSQPTPSDTRGSKAP